MSAVRVAIGPNAKEELIVRFRALLDANPDEGRFADYNNASRGAADAIVEGLLRSGKGTTSLLVSRDVADLMVRRLQVSANLIEEATRLGCYSSDEWRRLWATARSFRTAAAKINSALGGA